ncbi:hypothetical protein BsWGS_05219 [Bradybaena similaris]
MCAILIVSVTVTVESSNIGGEYRSNYNNPELSGVEKREADSSLPGGTNNVSISSITSVSAAGPLLPHDDKDVQKKLNCSSLEANKLNKTNCPNTNRSDDPNSNLSSWKQKMLENKDMLLRTLYVTLGITGIIVVYFVARTCWLRSRRTKSRKYRIIAQNGDQRDLEMEPLGDGNDDDEDYTVFELNGRKK